MSFLQSIVIALSVRWGLQILGDMRSRMLFEMHVDLESVKDVQSKPDLLSRF